MRNWSVLWYLIKEPVIYSKVNKYLCSCPVTQMKKVLLIILTQLLVTVEAVADSNLYSGEVVVASQAEDERNEVIPEVLIQVLQKLSGLREMPISPSLDDALQNADRMLLSFRYINVDRAGSDGNIKQELHLVANFMQPEVDRVVQQIGLPRWQQERPPVQIWVVLDDGRGRQLIPVEYEYAWAAMEDMAALRGLPIEWPELDEEEAQLIDMSLVWGGYTDYLVERGAPGDGVAIVAARREGPQWTLRWNLAANGKNWSWRNSDDELMFALADGIHQMTDQIAAANAIAASVQGEWTVDVTVGQLRNATDYAACLGYLQGLSLVTAVDVLGAEPGLVHFRMQLNAAPEYLGEAFNRSTVLLPARSGSDYEYEFLR